MQLSVPSLMGHTMQCNYTLEVHLYYQGLTTKKLNAAVIPIQICRPIKGQLQMNYTGPQMMIASAGMPVLQNGIPA